MHKEKTPAEKLGRLVIGISFIVLGVIVLWKVSVPIFAWCSSTLTPYIGFFGLPISFILASIPPVLLEPLADWALDKASQETEE